MLRPYKIVRQVLSFVRGGGLGFWAGRNRVLTNEAFIEDSDVKFFVSSIASLGRVKYAHLKEPMTQRWIDRMDATDCLWDVGANIGIFSLRAAAKGVKVVAIEPLLGNFVELQRSLDLNPRLGPRVTPIFAGLSDRSGPDTLTSPTTTAGFSGAQLGKVEDELGRAFSAPISRQVMAFRGDDLLLALEEEPYASFFPTHVKIDVDGIELDCLRGLSAILTSDRIKSLLVETGPSQWGSAAEIEAFLSERGFTETESEPTTPRQTVFHNRVYQKKE